MYNHLYLLNLVWIFSVRGYYFIKKITCERVLIKFEDTNNHQDDYVKIINYNFLAVCTSLIIILKKITRAKGCIQFKGKENNQVNYVNNDLLLK